MGKRSKHKSKKWREDRPESTPGGIQAFNELHREPDLAEAAARLSNLLGQFSLSPELRTGDAARLTAEMEAYTQEVYEKTRAAVAEAAPGDRGSWQKVVELLKSGRETRDMYYDFPEEVIARCLADIPTSLVSTEDIADWLVEHYLDDFGEYW